MRNYIAVLWEGQIGRCTFTDSTEPLKMNQPSWGSIWAELSGSWEDPQHLTQAKKLLQYEVSHPRVCRGIQHGSGHQQGYSEAV